MTPSRTVPPPDRPNRIPPEGDLLVSRSGFGDAGNSCGLPLDVQEALWARLSASQPAAPPPLGAQRVVWYAGAATSLTAMGLFLGTSWATAGSATGLLLTLLYLAVFVAVCEALRVRGHALPAGLLAATVVALVPLAVFAAQETFGLWDQREFGHYASFFDYVSGQWAAMELATLTASVAVWRRYRTPFLLLPTAVTGWFATMDLAAAVGGEAGSPLASALVTAVLLGAGLALDARGLRGEAFWLHLSGLASLAWTLGALDVETGARMLLVGLSGGVAVVAGVLLQRRLHLSAGAVFLYAALSYLAFEVFGGSPLFALALGALGVAVTVGGLHLDRTARATTTPAP